jgi:hypothetical protein
VCLKTDTEMASEMSCFFKKIDDGQVTETKIVSVDISCTLFSLFDLLTFEDGANRLF